MVGSRRASNSPQRGHGNRTGVAGQGRGNQRVLFLWGVGGWRWGRVLPGDVALGAVDLAASLAQLSFQVEAGGHKGSPAGLALAPAFRQARGHEVPRSRAQAEQARAS